MSNGLVKNLIALALLLSTVSVMGAPVPRDDASSSSQDFYQAPANTIVKHKQIEDETSIFDDVRLHAGLNFVNSFQDFQLAPGIRERGGIRGFALTFGADLFSPHWIAQGVLFNLPETQISDSRVSSNGFELRLLFDTAIAEGLTVHGGAGIASRGYSIKTTARPNSPVITAEHTYNSGATVLASGLDYWPSGNFSMGLELSSHLPMATGDDPSSIDLGVNFNGHF